MSIYLDVCPQNEYDRCLLGLARDFQQRDNTKSCYVIPPWQNMPATGQRFQRRGSIVLPMVEGVASTVLTWRVPPGWDGVIITVTNVYTGAGFIESSGDLVWRLQNNYRYFRDLGNIDISLGDLRFPYELDGAGYRVYTNDTLTYSVTLGVGALGRLAPGERIICGITGWLFPHAEYRRAEVGQEQGQTMPFPPFARITPAGPMDVNLITLPEQDIGNIGPVITWMGTTRRATYCCLVNGPASNVGNGAWNPLGGVPTTRSYAHMMKSTDGGNTWAEVDAASPNAPELPPLNMNSIPATNKWLSAQIQYDDASGIIYVCHYTWDYVNYATASPHQLAIARFDTGAVSGTEGWMVPLTGYGDANAPEAHTMKGYISVCTFGFVRRGSDGHFFVFCVRTEAIPGSPRWGAPVQDAYDRTYVSEYTPGAGWGVAQLFAGAALEEQDYTPYGAVVGLDNRVHCFMYQNVPADGPGPWIPRIVSRSINSAGVWDVLDAVVTDIPADHPAAREWPVDTPHTRVSGGDVEIMLGMTVRSGILPVRWHTSRGNSAANLTTADFTQEHVTNLPVPMWGMHISSNGTGVDGDGLWYALSWELFRYWDLSNNAAAGAGWTAATQLLDISPDMKGAVNVGSHCGAVGAFTGIAPFGAAYSHDIFYWELGRALAPGGGGGAGAAGGGGGLTRTVVCSPANSYDKCLHALYRDFCERLFLCPPLYEPKPWLSTPGFCNRFQRVGSLPLPADTGLDSVVLTWRVPPGWDGVITAHAHSFTGMGFDEGSGDLTWRLRRDYSYLRDLGAITESIGASANPYEVEGAGYRIYSNQTITYVVSVAVGAAARLDPTGRIVCLIAGWLYPNQYRRQEIHTRRMTPVHRRARGPMRRRLR